MSEMSGVQSWSVMYECRSLSTTRSDVANDDDDIADDDDDNDAEIDGGGDMTSRGSDLKYSGGEQR